MTPLPYRSALAVLAAAAIGCGAGDDDGTTPAVADAGAKADGAVASSAPDATVAVPAPGVSYLRVAGWSPDAPPVDFCLGDVDSGAFYGPLLSTGFALDGAAPAIAYPSASAYMAVPAGVFDARIVSAGSATCAQGLGFDAKGVVLAPDQRATLALEGRSLAPSASALRAVFYGDDTDVPSGDLALRFLNANPEMDPATLTLVPPPAIASETSPFGAVGATLDAGLDRNGYAVLLPLSAVGVGVNGPPTPATTITAAAGAVISLILLPSGAPDAAASTDASAPAWIVECIDNAGTVGLFASCAVVTH